MNIAIVGLGLMGGSLSLSLKEQNSKYYFIGVDKDPVHRDMAVSLGLVSKCVDLPTAVREADLIFLTVPVDVIEQLLPEVLDQISHEQVVIDLGSTKERICQAVRQHPNRGQYVAAHPMAGTENTGPEAALVGLYNGKINILCETELSNDQAVDQAQEIFKALGMRIIHMDASAHDKHVAYVSHLSHVSSFMLGLTVLDIEKDEKNIFNLAGSGFQSTVRLAMSSPAMWAPIFSQNSRHISSALEEYIHHLQDFKNWIDRHDSEKMTEAMQQANDVRRILKQPSRDLPKEKTKR